MACQSVTVVWNLMYPPCDIKESYSVDGGDKNVVEIKGTLPPNILSMGATTAIIEN